MGETLAALGSATQGAIQGAGTGIANAAQGAGGSMLSSGATMLDTAQNLSLPTGSQGFPSAPMVYAPPQTPAVNWQGVGREAVNDAMKPGSGPVAIPVPPQLPGYVTKGQGQPQGQPPAPAVLSILPMLQQYLYRR